MRLRISILMAIMLLGSCDDEKELHPLSMAKIPYTGNELRTDGYYYSDISEENIMGITVFYRDGVCLHMFTQLKGLDTFDFIENDILRDKALMSRLWSTPDQIGVFQINKEGLKFETWHALYDIPTFSYFGEVVNDSTFILKHWTNDQDKEFQENRTFRFKQFSPKPDSTNRFIK